jgi:excisionase family DNA binding protein
MIGKPSRLSRFLSLKDVALALSVSIKSLRRWIDAGDLRVHRFGHQLRVAAFLSQRRR